MKKIAERGYRLKHTRRKEACPVNSERREECGAASREKRKVDLSSLKNLKRGPIHYIQDF